MAGDPAGGVLVRYRNRLLLAPVLSAKDRNQELKVRSRLWEAGQFDDLIQRFLGQHAEMGRRAARLNPIRQAIEGLVGGMAHGSAVERA